MSSLLEPRLAIYCISSLPVQPFIGLYALLLTKTLIIINTNAAPYESNQKLLGDK